MESSDSGAPPSSAEIEKLTGQLAKDPRSKAFIPLAEEYVKISMLQEAATVLEEGLKVYPSFITALVALGRVYIQLDASAKAQSRLEEAVKISPDNVVARKMLARIYAKDQNWDAAKRSCDMVLFGYAQDEEMLALKAELEGKGPSEAAAAPLQAAATAPHETTELQGQEAPRSSKAGESPEDPTAGPEASDMEAEPTVVLAQFPQEGTDEGLDHEQTSGAERSDPQASPAVAPLQEMLERVRQRRAS